MALGKRSGQTAPGSKASSCMGSSKALANSTGQTVARMWEPITMMICIQVQIFGDFTPGLMADCTKVSGKKAKCTGWVHTLGPTGANIKVNMLIVYRKALAPSHGQAESSILEVGKKVYKMAWDR